MRTREETSGSTPGPRALRLVRAPRGRLRGRDSQLQAIGECIGAVLRGGARAILIEGPPGAGKSSLLAEAASMAAAAGFVPAVAEAFETDRGVPFAPLAAAFTDAGNHEERLGELVRGRAADAHWVLRELQGAMEEAAGRGPIAVLLDNLQWADPSTVAAVRELPGRLSGTPVLWVLTMRGGELDPRAQEAVGRLRSEGAQRMKLGPLSADAVGAMLADRAGAEPEEPLVDLAGRALGNPLLVAELIDGLLEEGRVDVSTGRAVIVGEALPRRLTASMAERLDRLGPATRQAVRVASVLGSRFSVEHLAAILGRPPTELLADIEEAVRADLFRSDGNRMAFRHDLLREATAQTLARPVRRALVRQIASVLLDLGAAPVEVAQQLADAAEPGDREAVATLRRAALSIAATDASAAAELSTRALGLMAADDEGRAELVAEAIIHLHAAARHDEATALGRDALTELLTPAEEAEVRLSLSSMVTRSPEARIDENRRALALSFPSHVLRARHSAWLAYNLATVDRDESRRVAATSLEEPHGASDAQAHIVSTLALVSVDSAEGRSREALDRIVLLRGVARRAEPGPHLQLIDFFHACTLVELGRVRDALALLEANVGRARADRNGWLMQTWAQIGSVLRYASGSLADARSEAESAPTGLGSAAEINHVGASAAMITAQVAVHTGDAQRLATASETGAALCESGSPGIRCIGRWILALSAMAQERPSEAARRLSEGDASHVSTVLPRDPGHHVAAARIAVAAGDSRLADREVRRAEELAALNPGIAVREAVALHTRGLVEDDPMMLTAAAERFRKTERPLLFAAAAEDAGVRLTGPSGSREGLRLLDEAFEVLVRADAAADARRVARALRHRGVRRHAPARPRPLSGWGSLTESELRVIRLVARGATNRDAADRLFLSPHTVSSHLRSAFGKLGINSRVELARIAVIAEGPAAAGVDG